VAAKEAKMVADAKAVEVAKVAAVATEAKAAAEEARMAAEVKEAAQRKESADSEGKAMMVDETTMIPVRGQFSGGGGRENPATEVAIVLEQAKLHERMNERRRVSRITDADAR